MAKIRYTVIEKTEKEYEIEVSDFELERYNDDKDALEGFACEMGPDPDYETGTVKGYWDILSAELIDD